MDTITEELIQAAKTVGKFTLEGEHKKALVIDIYDGDTITVVFKHFDKINWWKVRLLGINSPEIRPSRSIKNRNEIITAAKNSRDYLSNLILNKIIYLQCDNFDSFGRILANIYLTKEDLLTNDFSKTVNNLMLETNNASIY